MRSRQCTCVGFGPLLLLALFALVAPATGRAGVARGTITLAVDGTDAPRKILHVRVTIPAAAGPISLSFPKWIPGEHGPTGPLIDVAGLRVTAGGKPLAWERDLVDMYAVRCTAPAGTRAIEASFDFTSPADISGFTSSASFTQNLALISWNQVLMYPTGEPSDSLTYAASLRLPAGWSYGTALPVERAGGGEIRFAPASLTTLVDSPVLAGAYFRSVDLAPGATPREILDMASDSKAGLAMTDAQVASHRRLMAEANALFGAHHFRQYHFLLTLSDHVAHFGLEHHESSDDRTWERAWVDDNKRVAFSDLLSHELTHSWNGKYRRPADLTTPDFQAPMKDDLLWVYEGLTQYIGFVLAGRSGIRSPEEVRGFLALAAAALDNTPGRTWRPLIDTAVEAQLLYEAPDQWAAWRRSTDFYDEGLLIWLEADVTIRRLTNSSRSLDDFCKLFHGGPSGPPRVLTYTYDDVVAALNRVAPYDWRTFFDTRLHSLGPHAPMGGIEGGGWKVAYADTLSSVMKALAEANERMDLSTSIGVTLETGEQRKGFVVDVVPGSTAARAGVAPGVTIVGVNGRHWSKEVMLDAVRATRDGTPLELLVDNGEFYRTCRLDYRGGPRYPQLARIAGTPDLLGDIVRPHAPR
jgi:predicted metalloprotease with PDZ domain